MYCLRQAASRLLLSSNRVAIRSAPRSTPSSALRLNFASRPIQSQLQSRWNSDDAHNKQASNESIAEAVAQHAEQREAASFGEEATLDQYAAQESEQHDREEPTLRRSNGYNSYKYRPEPEPKTTIFIGNLFYDVTAEDLKNQFSKFGTVRRVNLIHDQRGISKGFGYVDYDSVEAAQRAIQEMHLRIFEGRRASVQFAQTQMKQQRDSRPSKSLYIGNLPFEMTDSDLNELFSDIVNVIDVRVAIDRRTGQPRGFCHADFVDLESSRNAMEALSRKMPYGKKLRIDYSTKHKGLNRQESSENAETAESAGIAEPSEADQVDRTNRVE